MENTDPTQRLDKMEQDMANLMQMMANLSTEIAKDRFERQEQAYKDKGKAVEVEGESSRPQVLKDVTPSLVDGTASRAKQPYDFNEPIDVEGPYVPPVSSYHPNTQATTSQHPFMPKEPTHQPIPITIPYTVEPEPVQQDDSLLQKFKQLEQKFHALEGAADLGPSDPESLCLVSGITLPSKFKIPEFDKYDGIGCPRSHIKRYCRKMSACTRDEKLLIHCFQESLTQDALAWYDDLEPATISSWESLYNAFIRQYRYNVDMAPTRRDLEKMIKNGKESFKEYACRWRSVAAKVRPPVTEKEMTGLFIGTLKPPFVDHLITCISMSFSDVIAIGDRIEEFIQRGIMQSPEQVDAVRRPVSRKREADVSNIVDVPRPPSFPQQSYPRNPTPRYTSNTYTPGPRFSGQTMSQPPPQNYQHYSQQSNFPTTSQYSQPPSQQTANPPSQQYMTDQRPNTRPRYNFPPLPAPPSLIYRQLLAAGRMQPVPPPPPLQPPYPSYHNPNAFCEYHSGAPGHTIDNCNLLKRKLQWMIHEGQLTFSTSTNQQSPNIQTNPLPNHQSPGPAGVNMLDIGVEDAMWKIPEHKSWRIAALKGLVEAGHVLENFNYELDKGCVYDGSMDHDIQSCSLFENFITLMCRRGIVRLTKSSPVTDVYVTDQNYKAMPYTYNQPPVNIQLPSQSSTPIPFVCNLPLSTDHSTNIQLPPTSMSFTPFNIILPTDHTINAPININTSPATSISNTTNQAPTKLFSPIIPPIKASTVEVITRTGRVVAPSGPGETSNTQRNDESPEQNDDALKIVHKSDYSIIDQLHRTPSRISLLDLIKSSAIHREALRKILCESYVADHITPEGFEHMIGQVRMANVISFSDEEIDPKGQNHMQALYITLKYKEFMVAKVLIDNGSALNILPTSTIPSLSIDPKDIKSDPMVARAFDGSQRGIFEAVDLEIVVGGQPFLTTFHILDIIPNYTMLLGRPWIHLAGAVPSTLHQKVKFIADGRLITINSEESMLVSSIEGVPYVEQGGNVAEPAFTSFEVVCAEKGVSNNACKKESLIFYELFYANRVFPKPWKIAGNIHRFGIGYQEEVEEMVKLKGKSSVPSIGASFYSAGSSTSPMEKIIEQMEGLGAGNDDARIKKSSDLLETQEGEDAEDEVALGLKKMFN